MTHSNASALKSKTVTYIRNHIEFNELILSNYPLPAKYQNNSFHNQEMLLY